MAYLRIVPTSAKFHSSALMPVLGAALPSASLAWNRDDCSRVLTRSNGAVTTPPHIAPSLQRSEEYTLAPCSVGVRASDADGARAHPPATKCTIGGGFGRDADADAVEEAGGSAEAGGSRGAVVFDNVAMVGVVMGVTVRGEGVAVRRRKGGAQDERLSARVGLESLRNRASTAGGRPAGADARASGEGPTDQPTTPPY